MGANLRRTTGRGRGRDVGRGGGSLDSASPSSPLAMGSFWPPLMFSHSRRAREVSWLFLGTSCRGQGGPSTQRDATGRPWRQPRMGDRRRPRAARPKRASGCRDCRPLLRALSGPSYAWERRRVWQRHGHKLPHSAEGILWECGGPKRGWVMLPGPFAGRAALQLRSRQTLGPSPRLMTPDRRGFRTGALTGMACSFGCSHRSPSYRTGGAGVSWCRTHNYTQPFVYFICFTIINQPNY